MPTNTFRDARVCNEREVRICNEWKQACASIQSQIDTLNTLSVPNDVAEALTYVGDVEEALKEVKDKMLSKRTALSSVASSPSSSSPEEHMARKRMKKV